MKSGSSFSLLAATFEPAIIAGKPFKVVRAAKSSFEGRPMVMGTAVETVFAPKLSVAAAASR